MRTLDSGAGDSQDTQGKCQLAEDLPAIRDVQDMFHDMVKKLPELRDFIKKLGRPLRVATMCSGTESPLLALDKIGVATEREYGAKLAVDHVFSCEIEPFKQAYIERNFAPPILFRDIRELDEDQATTAYGALVDVPGFCDMLVAGTSCVDYSNLNNEQKTINEAGESGQTFRGMMTWVQKKQPPVVILENVCGAPWEQISLAFQAKGYAAHFMRVDTKRFYIPHTRTRVYLFATKVPPKPGMAAPPPGEDVHVIVKDPNPLGRPDRKDKEMIRKPTKYKAYFDYLQELSGKIPFDESDCGNGYVFDKKKGVGGKLIQQWKDQVKQLERPASSTLEAFLFDSDDPRVHKGRQMLALPGEDSTRAGTDWARCESRHQRARLEEGLGARRPFTNWEGGCTMPDYAWNDWGKAQTDRVLDLMDIDYLRLAQADTDSTHKTLVWNLSQNVDRTTGSGAAGICPCLTPSMVPFVTNRGGPLVGIEALSLQGIPVDDLLLTRESEGQMSDLAGNAMTTTVVGACMLSALMVVKDTILDYSKVAEKGLAAEAKKRRASGVDVGAAATSLSVGGAAYAQAAAAKVEGVPDLLADDLALCAVVPKGDAKGLQKLLAEASAAARLCVCEAQTGVVADIKRCLDCGHTACGKCCGRPEHNYADYGLQRTEPTDFAAKLKRTLPMRVTLEGLDVAHASAKAKALAEDSPALFGSQSSEDDSRDETWRRWTQAMKTIAAAEFLFRDVRRADVWIARYVCPGADEVALELRMGAALARPEWRVIVTPAPTTGEPIHEVFTHPVARMRVAPGAKHLLEGDWAVLVPVRRAFELEIEGRGPLVESWQETLGMPADASKIAVMAKDRKPWTSERFSEYKVSWKRKADKSALDLDVEGTYKLFEKCGAAQASLHKRVGDDKLNKHAEMYFFLDPIRNSKGEKDFFVFADNHRRLQYGEHRVHAARVSPEFRASDSNAVTTYECFTDGQWMKVETLALEERKTVATLATPKNAASLGVKVGGCANAVAVMKASVTLPDVDAADWPEGDFVTLRNDRSNATFGRLAWFTSRLDLPEGVQKFVPLVAGDAKASARLCDTACPRCAPMPPTLEWVRRADETNEKKIECREDPEQAAVFEQTLKRRPAPFVVQWRKRANDRATKKQSKTSSDTATGDVVIAVNPATLVHRALANITGGVARERSAARLYDAGKNATPEMEWQIVRHAEMDTAAPLEPFKLTSNRRDPAAMQPPGWNVKQFPLRPEQLRSLHWMLERESSDQAPFVEEEVAESVLPALGLRMDGRARVKRLVRGGIIADQVGYGKTAITIGAILANQIQWPVPGALGTASKPVPVRAIPTKATLVLAPSQLLRQWPREVAKFSKGGTLKVVAVRTVADITHLTVAEIQDADVVICATSVLRSPLYFERLARLAGAGRMPDCKSSNAGRHFAAAYHGCLAGLEAQTETLTGAGGAATASKRVRKGKGEIQNVRIIAPKRLKGQRLVQATKAAGGKEGFKYMDKTAAMERAKAEKAEKAEKAKAAKEAAKAAQAAKKKATPKSTPVKKQKTTPTTTPVKKTPVKKAARAEDAAASPTSARRATPKRAAAKPVSYAEEYAADDDSDFEMDSEEETDEEFETVRHRKVAKARAAKSKKRTKADDASDEEDETFESVDKDHWGFDTREVRADWTEMTSPPLEMFHWRRVVVDEFTYLKPSDRCVVLGLKAEARWVLSGTPPVGAFSEIKDTAALLGTNLGSDEQPRFTKSEITKAETFQFFKERPTQQWHINRHAVAQGFLDRFVRQNIAEIDEIRSEEIPVEIALRPAERAIYLELDHYLQAMDMKARQQKKGGNKGDRDKRLAKVLQGSATAEEALIKRCAKFELDDDEGNALRTCQDIINVRQAQLQECQEALDEKILDTRYFYREWKETAKVLQVELFDAEDKEEDNQFIKWQSMIRGEGAGDPEGTEMLVKLLDAASEARAADHVPKTRVPPVNSILKLHIDGAWRVGVVHGITGTQKQTLIMTFEKGFKPNKSNDFVPAAESEIRIEVKKMNPEHVVVIEDGGVLATELRKKEAEQRAFEKALSRGTAGDTPGTPAKRPVPASPALASAANTPAKPTPSRKGAPKKLEGELNNQKWNIREEVRALRMLTRELVGRVRSLRFFRSVRDLQRLSADDDVSCGACAAALEKGASAKSPKKRAAAPAHAKKLSGVLSTCGHVGCLSCLKRNANLQECGVPGCECPARFSSVIDAESLGSEKPTADADASRRLKSPAKKAKGKAAVSATAQNEPLELGSHGSKMAHLVQRIRDTPPDERILVFVQFPDLMKQVADVLEQANIKTLKLKGSVHQQTGALDEFQKEELEADDARVLLLLSRDESASGANLTTANHAIFVHPLLTTSQYEYEASETQAIGRIRRYGQTRLVQVWRFLVKDSIDAEVFKQRTDAMTVAA